MHVEPEIIFFDEIGRQRINFTCTLLKSIIVRDARDVVASMDDLETAGISLRVVKVILIFFW